MTDPLDEDDTTAKSSMDWPDPSRPIVNQQPGYGQAPPAASPAPMSPPWPARRPARRPRWPFVLSVLLAVGVLAVVLVVWVL
ncbi:MAG TPA: hypothetical protein VHH15_15395 [Actinophytocola sp.]|nr:hypothetical protein [Actinophytocola sp.]